MATPSTNLSRRIVAEAVGTAFLLAAVIGSGIMGERLAGGNLAIALLANTLATGAALVALILAFGPISGAHLNPAVTLADAWQGGLPWPDAAGYVVAQIWSFRRSGRRPCDVWEALVFRCTTRSCRRSPDSQRVCRHFRTAFCDLGLREAPSPSGSFCRGRVHHVGLLVYGLNVVR